MPGDLSTFAATQVLNYISGQSTHYTTFPFTTYVALLTGAVTNNSSMTTVPELSLGGYARQAVTWGAASGSLPVSASNTATLTFGPFTADMTQAVTYCCLTTSLTGTTGDYIAWWQLDVAQQLLSGQSLLMATGKLVLNAA